MHPILGTRTTTAVASREHRLPEEWISIIVAKLYSLAERSLYSKSSRSSQEVCIHSYHFLCILNNNFDENFSGRQQYWKPLCYFAWIYHS